MDGKIVVAMMLEYGMGCRFSYEIGVRVKSQVESGVIPVTVPGLARGMPLLIT